ncbi:putative methylmalonate-semialdehyde dehydrogenase [acylating], mitochondrial [Parelaphostrongylus tenuis]|uniref:Probable methylmalonate-semialdehyde/malonate-semialdehyde dehydrogenase [acylating], mitochondrial n=1 Tax=Parelaphostrongylus tenuis TaxID=148309 RepID=A0AAD5MB99_PARTN|nr:putative methylmalonate-semialdehyde dehydrogenase [acylating], mitochondrial [Parelaphostrongylus tenuis]
MLGESLGLLDQTNDHRLIDHVSCRATPTIAIRAPQRRRIFPNQYYYSAYNITRRMLSGLKRLSVRCGQQYVSLLTTTSAYGESTVKMWIDGRPVESKTSEWIDLTNPATNEVISRVLNCTEDEMQTAVDSCKKAFDSWKSVSPLTRQQAFFRLQSLIKRDMKKIADNITKEQGKTLPDAEGDVSRGLQVVEHACSVPSLMLGETLPNVSRDMDTYSWRIPLGVISWYLPVHLPDYDSPMDVSHCSRYCKHNGTQTI